MKDKIVTYTVPSHCDECGTGFEPMSHIISCGDCRRTFCDEPKSCLDDHKRLGTCPDHADGVLAAEPVPADVETPGEHLLGFSIGVVANARFLIEQLPDSYERTEWLTAAAKYTEQYGEWAARGLAASESAS